MRWPSGLRQAGTGQPSWWLRSATMDGSRALYGISKDGMTIKELGVLNQHNVPARAMTLDAILNIFLISYFAVPLEILAVSNVGYVFATCTALSGAQGCGRAG